jgi:hypothetical protein
MFHVKTRVAQHSTCGPTRIEAVFMIFFNYRQKRICEGYKEMEQEYF